MRERLLRRHTRALYAELTDHGAEALRADALVYARRRARARAGADARARWTPSASACRRTRRAGRSPRAGCSATCSPAPRAARTWSRRCCGRRSSRWSTSRSSRPRARSTSARAVSSARGAVGVVELRNPRHLNAEDDTTLGPLRGRDRPGPARPADRGRRAARRRGRAPALRGPAHLRRRPQPHPPVPRQDLLPVLPGARPRAGAQGLPRADEPGPARPEDTHEKLWIAAAETYAIGGACQLLLACDHIIAERGCRLTLPARNEGIIPGAANLRLPRFVGDRLARQAILSGRRVRRAPERAGRRDRRAPEEMDAAVEHRARRALDRPGAVSGVANRRALRIGEEPLDLFREYMAVYAREQASCHFSPALIRNLEENWRAHERRSERSSAPPATSSSALQRERLRATVARVLAHVPPTAARLHAAGVRAARAIPPARRRPPAVHHRRTTCASTTRSACWPCRASSSSACTPPAARAASRPSSATPATTSSVWAEVMARSLATAGVRPGMVVHNAYGYGLFTGGLGFHQGAERLGATVVPVSGGMTDAPGAAAARLRRPGAVLHAVLRAAHRAGAARGRRRPERARARGRALRRRAVDARRCARRSRRELGLRRDQLLRALGDRRARRGGASASRPATACTSTRTTSWSRSSIPTPARAAARRRGGRAGLHHADQGGAAAAALPHRRHRLARPRDRARAGGPCARMSPVRGRSDDMLIIRGVNLYPSEVEHAAARRRRRGAALPARRRAPGRARRAHGPLRAAPTAAPTATALRRRGRRALRESTGVHVAVELLAPGASRAARARPCASSIAGAVSGTARAAGAWARARRPSSGRAAGGSATG